MVFHEPAFLFLLFPLAIRFSRMRGMVEAASHMPRVMALCRRHGVRAEAAPCGHRTLKAPQTRHRLRLDESYPNAASLARSERAVYEYLGNAWEGLKTWWFSLREGPDK